MGGSSFYVFVPVTCMLHKRQLTNILAHKVLQQSKKIRSAAAGLVPLTVFVLCIDALSSLPHPFFLAALDDEIPSMSGDDQRRMYPGLGHAWLQRCIVV